MQFIVPGIFWAFLALSIPILIHLFYFRRYKKVYFSNTTFLSKIKEETKNRSRLRNLLVLLCRILAYSFLIFAFAQPFIPVDKKVDSGPKAVSIFIDNSFSMEGQGQDVSLLDEAKSHAISIIDAFNEEDRFQILNCDFKGQHQRLVGKEEAIKFIEEIEISPDNKSIKEILERQSQVINDYKSNQRWRILISDFQKNMDSDISIDSSEVLQLLPLKAVVENNLSIDSVWFEQDLLLPDQTAVLLMKVTNYGEQDREDIRIAFEYSGQTRPIGTLDLPSGQSRIDSISFKPIRNGWQTGKIVMEDYPVTFDDSYHFAFKVQDALNILSIGQDAESIYLQAAFGNSELANFEHFPTSNIQYSSFEGKELIILHNPDQISTGLINQLNAYVREGGNLYLFPGPLKQPEFYSPLLQNLGISGFADWTEESQIVSSINTSEFVFKDVFDRISRDVSLPKVEGFYKKKTGSSRGEEILMSMRNGDVFLGKWKLGNGRIYLCYSPLDPGYSDLVSRGEIFIPMLYRSAMSVGHKSPISYTLGKDNLIAVPNILNSNDPVYKIVGPEEVIASKVGLENKSFLDVSQILNTAGLYDLMNNDTLVSKLGFNYNRTESDMTFFNINELNSEFPQALVLQNQRQGELTASIREASEGKKLWFYCVIFALVFLLCEQLLLRFMK